MKFANVFSDHMVVQRDMPIPVWGWAQTGEAVAVSLAGNTAEAVAGADGRWQAVLPALPAGGPHVLTASTGATTLNVNDVLVGEVWVCSGQSNMEFGFSGANNAEEELAASGDPLLRMYTVVKSQSLTPEPEVKGAWAVSTPEDAGMFSAVGYFFARRLRRDLGVPIGMLHTSWGGTPAETWTSRDTLAADPAFSGLMASITGMNEAETVDMEAVLARWQAQTEIEDQGIAEEARGWSAPECDDAGWPIMTLPQVWLNAGIPYNGIVWFRLVVELPASWAGKALSLNLGSIDKSDIAFFNGVEVGSMDHREFPMSWNTPRHYTVPGSLVRAGRNVIAVRVFSHIYDAGFRGPGEEMVLCAAGETPLSLAGDWRYQVELNLGRVTVTAPQCMPTMLYNAMIAPLIPYAIRGAIWYQGESNAGNPELYRVLFPAMITDWRIHWQQGNFPFYFVQLANFMARNTTPVDTDWARLREAQTFTLALPETGMAVAIDIGDGDDIHPRNKQDVGNRLAQNALAFTYGQNIVPCGPLYQGMSVEGGAIRLSFDFVGSGLAAHEGPLVGFAIAGADRRFVWADARIDGETLVVSSPQVPAPVAVRYAWADNPACNFYNADGFPASPFRTDDWSRYQAPVAESAVAEA